MSRHGSLVLVTAAAATLAGSLACNREDKAQSARTTTEQGTTSTAPPASLATERDTALVRVVNAIPASQPADVYADDAKTFSAVEYKTVTPYKEVQDNEVTFKLQLAGRETPEPAGVENELLMDGRHYTVVAMPGEGGEMADLKVLKDEMAPPDAGKVKVRVVNAAPDAGKVDVMLAGKKDALISGVGANDDSGYTEIEPLAGKLIVRNGSKKRVVAEVPQASLEPGKLYTLFVVGRTVGSPKAEAMMVQDELVPPAMPPAFDAPPATASPR